MTKYERVETLGHIKRAEVLGVDPLKGNIIIELHGGPQDSDASHRMGTFSIEPAALEQFLLQADDALFQGEENPTRQM